MLLEKGRNKKKRGVSDNKGGEGWNDCRGVGKGYGGGGCLSISPSVGKVNGLLSV